MSDKTAEVRGIPIGRGAPLALIAGPCVIEAQEHTLRMAEAIHGICERLSLPLIFKASYDKANRSSITSFRGPGLAEGLRILRKVRDGIGVPVLSDIHEAPSIDNSAAVALQVVSKALGIKFLRPRPHDPNNGFPEARIDMGYLHNFAQGHRLGTEPLIPSRDQD